MADAGISLLEETEQPEFQGDPPNKGGWVIESPGTRPKGRSLYSYYYCQRMYKT